MTSPSWKFLPPRWNKAYRKAEDSLGILLDFGKEQVDKAKQNIEAKGIQDPQEMSVLQKTVQEKTVQ